MDVLVVGSDFLADLCVFGKFVAISLRFSFLLLWPGSER